MIGPRLVGKRYRGQDAEMGRDKETYIVTHALRARRPTAYPDRVRVFAVKQARPFMADARTVAEIIEGREVQGYGKKRADVRRGPKRAGDPEPDVRGEGRQAPGPRAARRAPEAPRPEAITAEEFLAAIGG